MHPSSPEACCVVQGSCAQMEGKDSVRWFKGGIKHCKQKTSKKAAATNGLQVASALKQHLSSPE